MLAGAAGRRPEPGFRRAPPGAGNAQLRGAREAQEDAFGFSDLDGPTFERLGVLCVVCDGMGGHRGGTEASTAATAAFLDTFRAASADEAAPSLLRRALDAANEAVVDAGRRIGADDAGTTLAAALVRAGSLHWIGVGDTRIALLRDGRLFQVNRDHTYRMELLRHAAAGDGRREDALADRQGERLTSSLGAIPVPLVDRSHDGLPLQSGDRVLVMTDGVYRALAPDELVGRMADDPHAACEAVIAAVLARDDPKQDNATIVAIDAPSTRPPATGARASPATGGTRDATTAPIGVAGDAATGPTAGTRRRWVRIAAAGVVLSLAAALGVWLGAGDDGGAPAAPSTATGAGGTAAPAAPVADTVRSRDLPLDGATAPAERGGVVRRAGERKAESR